MGYGGGKIVKQTDKFSKKIFAYYNPVGKLYAKFVFLGRILAVGVFLDDLFKSQPSIKCDTKQVGCELSCKNRFAPVSHVQIWQFNLFLGLLSSIIFTVFNMLNQRNYESYQRRMVHKNPIYDGRGNSFEIKYYWEKTKEGKTIINSGYIAVGYIAMLVFRLTYWVRFF